MSIDFIFGRLRSGHLVLQYTLLFLSPLSLSLSHSHSHHQSLYFSLYALLTPFYLLSFSHTFLFFHPPLTQFVLGLFFNSNTPLHIFFNTRLYNLSDFLFISIFTHILSSSNLSQRIFVFLFSHVILAAYYILSSSPLSLHFSIILLTSFLPLHLFYTPSIQSHPSLSAIFC